MISLLLGKPLHGQTRQLDSALDVLKLETELAEEAGVGWTSAGFALRRSQLPSISAFTLPRCLMAFVAEPGARIASLKAVPG